jgi:predicted Zn-dependent peptidase
VCCLLEVLKICLFGAGLAHLLEHMAFKGTPRIGTTDYRYCTAVRYHYHMVGSGFDIECDAAPAGATV